MSAGSLGQYDIAIVGAGPVGTLCALAHARRGARVALFEGNPRAQERMAGEWLHPPAVRVLGSVGIGVETLPESTEGRGFVVFPEDGSEPIVLPYLGESRGLACEHVSLVARLRQAVENEADIDFIHPARVSAVDDERVTFGLDGKDRSLTAGRVVGADGRASIVRRSLGLSVSPLLCSMMLGVTLRGVSLPLEGYGHVVLGGPGPILMYRPAQDTVRVMVDVPHHCWTPRDRVGFLSEAYSGLLPEPLGSAFVDALRTGSFKAATNQLRLRASYGNSRLVLIGDAAGHYHPMTAVGMTLGFGEALALAEGREFRDFVTSCFRATSSPEILAMGLYEVFADHRTEAVTVRQAIYRGWRASTAYRDYTIRILACEDRSAVGFGLAFCSTMARAVVGEIMLPRRARASRRTRHTFLALVVRLWWLLRGVLQLHKAKRTGHEQYEPPRDALARAFLTSMSPRVEKPSTARSSETESSDAGPALKNAAARLLDLQNEDGSWEGEMVWCPMLTAQYVLLHHIIGRPLEPGRRQRVLRSFERTRLEGGAWGLHEHSPPHLFVTTLVYAAARLLGVSRDDPLVEPARQFIQAEGILGIPSWGKFWLALLNLYDWRGVNAVLPELWRLPRRIPLHPSNWYCHTRLIYMAMAAVYVRRFQVPVTPEIAALREELFPGGFANADFSAARNRLREADLYARPGRWLKVGYAIARLYDRFHARRLRARCVEAILRRIEWELQTTSHTSISPVSGLLNILALWLHDPDHADCRRALERLDGWIWEDEDRGARVAGARSASWDTGFALQALAAAPEAEGVEDALRRGADFLFAHRIAASFDGFREAYRSDPKGGWCFAGGWHGWPVSDCTGEAVLGIVAAGRAAGNVTALSDASAFMLRSQNRDGGFGSYEA